MDGLKEKLSKELLGDLDVKILDSSVWRLPVHVVEIAYQTVLRTKMDILMKMILLSIQETAVQSEKELSNILLVEQLFITDLMSKLLRSGLIIEKDNTFELTNIGKEQLSTGIFVHEPEDNKKKLLFSPCHQKFLLNEISKQADETVEIYRYSEGFSNWTVSLLDNDKIITALKKAGVESVAKETQSVITDVLKTEALQLHWIACIEYQLYNEKEDLNYVRVWNILTAQWDELIELQLTEFDKKNRKDTSKREKNYV